MKRWQTLLPTALIGMSLVMTALWSVPVQAQEASRKVLYFFSSDFPPHPTVQFPATPDQETRFWQLLDREIQETGHLSLTNNPEEADYRVELRCGGVLNCSKLNVDVRDPDRNNLVSFTLRNFTPMWGILSSPNLEKVAQNLTERLEKRLSLLEQGAYGHYK